MCIFCDAIEKTSKAKQLCCFRFLSSASFRFSVSWFCFCYNHNFSSRIAFDGQLTRPARSTRLALSLSLSLPHAAGVAVNVEPTPTQTNSKSGSAEQSFIKFVLAWMCMCRSGCTHWCTYILYSLQKSFDKVAKASYHYIYMYICIYTLNFGTSRNAVSVSLFLFSFLLIQIVVILSPWLVRWRILRVFLP